MAGFIDSLRSLVTGLGTERDKRTSLQSVLVPVSALELSAAYRQSWLSRKIVDIIPNDMTRQWRQWYGSPEQVTLLEELEKDPLLQVRAKLNLALKKARLHGGAAIYIGLRGAKGSSPMRELIPDTVGRGDLEYLTVIGKSQISVGEINRDVRSPWYGQPKLYTMTSDSGSVEIHPSRIIRLVGCEIIDDNITVGDAWGDSVLQVVRDAVMSADLAHASVASLLSEAKVDVISVPGLSKHLVSQSSTDRLTARFSYANLMKSQFNMLLLDGDGSSTGEKWEQKQLSFAQMPEIMQAFMQIAAGAADIPVTRLLGQSPSGLNATGDADIRNYYDNVAARQEMELSPLLHVLDEVIIRSALGSRPDEVYSDWRPLWEMSEKERADIFSTKATAARALVGSSPGQEIIPIEALSQALINSFIEDGVLPGIEDAIDEFGTLAENIEADQQEADQKAALIAEGKLPDPSAPPEPPPGQQPPQPVQDASPRTLYVRRDVINSADIVRWARAQGIPNIRDDLHVTIVHSRAMVDWLKIGESWDEKITISAGGPRVMERLGPTSSAVALCFTSRMLRWRHEEMIFAGATSDYEDFQPHVTISTDAPELDITKIEPYVGEIRLGPEIFEEVRD